MSTLLARTHNSSPSIRSLLTIFNPTQMKIVGMCMLEEPWMAVEEFSQYGNLHTVLLACKEKTVLLRPCEQIHIARQVASGMAYIASQGIIHMDLASRNITLHADCVVKVGNFSMAMRFDPGTTHYVLKDRLKLSLRWLAVETFAGSPKVFSEASDVWAFAITMWEVLT
jgi:serine/threonine protein kinase